MQTGRSSVGPALQDSIVQTQDIEREPRRQTCRSGAYKHAQLQLLYWTELAVSPSAEQQSSNEGIGSAREGLCIHLTDSAHENADGPGCVSHVPLS